ncbi:hypothetical protein I4U23_004412 [Adineta vaga]|nr:hypothetical protein I4U23_004412 [Adineta vaga]
MAHVTDSSTIYDNDGKLISNDDYRTSATASIERHETPVVKCIEERFARFQGNIDIDHLEPLQVVKYTSDQEFKPHYDWFSQDDLVRSSGQRITTFFTYLYANCSQGETEFLKIRFNKSAHGNFCDILICDEKSHKFGLRFRPIPGNSIFWYNVNEQGKGDPLTHHAGRPPKKDGLKIGLNTWTRSTKITVLKRKDVIKPYDLYDRVLTRVADDTTTYMKSCVALVIVLQLLFKGLNDDCMEDTNIFDDLWSTTTNDRSQTNKRNVYNLALDDVVEHSPDVGGGKMHSWIKPTEAVNSWKNSPVHNAVMVQQGILHHPPMKAMGVGVYKGYACAWFGQERDSVLYFIIFTLDNLIQVSILQMNFTFYTFRFVANMPIQDCLYLFNTILFLR